MSVEYLAGAFRQHTVECDLRMRRVAERAGVPRAVWSAAIVAGVALAFVLGWLAADYTRLTRKLDALESRFEERLEAERRMRATEYEILDGLVRSHHPPRLKGDDHVAGDLSEEEGV